MSNPVNDPQQPADAARPESAQLGGQQLPPASAQELAGSVPARSQRVTDLADGEWHRMHPATPLLKGGLVLLVVLGYLIANLRDHLISIFLPNEAREWGGNGNNASYDPVDWVLANNLVMVALLVLIAIVALVVLCFWLVWRAHTFRITTSDVEVRRGILQRKHTRAPLDRVQSVNFTRPFLARLVGLAKLEVVGAGTDSNLQLEYLKTSSAEQVRAEILRLASGARQQRGQGRGANPAAGQTGAVTRLADTVSSGIHGIIAGDEAPVPEPASVVNIPVSRMLLAHLASAATAFLLLFVIGIVIAAAFGNWGALFGLLPGLIGFGVYYINSVFKTLRYSISPTPDGARVTFGLTTTITETIPPGRIHAIEISQSVFWRPMGWWKIRINRLSGRSAAQQQSADPFATLLPVGTRTDVVRVLGVVYPEMTATEMDELFAHGILGPQENDPFVNTPKRALILRLLSWKRNGYLLTPQFLLFRRGIVWRQLAMFPLVRAQGISIRQGPLARAFRVGTVLVNTVTGQVSTALGVVDRDRLEQLFDDAERNAIVAGQTDRSHRWAESRIRSVTEVGAHAALGDDLSQQWHDDVAASQVFPRPIQEQGVVSAQTGSNSPDAAVRGSTADRGAGDAPRATPGQFLSPVILPDGSSRIEVAGQDPAHVDAGGR